MNGNQRAQLKKIAHNMDPMLIIGKNGLSDNLIKQIDDLLEKRELVKIKVLNNNFDDKDEMLDEILQRTDSLYVSHVGFTYVIYRENEDPDKRVINLN